jgi:hypothetical protein
MSKVADPIFSKDDGKPKLPPELKDKTAEEVAAYYERREQILMDRMRQQPAPQPPPKKEEPVDDKIDLFNDPAGSIDRVVNRKVAAAADRVAGVINPALISACKITLKDAHTDYARFITEIEANMAKMTPEAQTNPDYWELTYQTVKGRHADELASEAEERGRKSANPVERSTPKGQDPPKPRTLSDEEKVIARKFDIDESHYIKAADRYDNSQDLPLTLDSKKPRKKAS